MRERDGCWWSLLSISHIRGRDCHWPTWQSLNSSNIKLLNYFFFQMIFYAFYRDIYGQVLWNKTELKDVVDWILIFKVYPNKVASIGNPNSELKSNRMRRVRGQNSYFSVNTQRHRHGHGPEARGGGGGRRHCVPGRGVPGNPLVTGWPGKPRGYSVSAKVRFNALHFSGRERERVPTWLS